MKPDKVYVTGIKYTIEFKPWEFITGDSGIEGAYGGIDLHQLRILVADNVPTRLQREALQHEISHAAWNGTGLGEGKLKEERVIKTLSMALYSTYTDPRNAVVLDWIYPAQAPGKSD